MGEVEISVERDGERPTRVAPDGGGGVGEAMDGGARDAAIVRRRGGSLVEEFRGGGRVRGEDEGVALPRFVPHVSALATTEHHAPASRALRVRPDAPRRRVFAGEMSDAIDVGAAEVLGNAGSGVVADPGRLGGFRAGEAVRDERGKTGHGGRAHVQALGLREGLEGFGIEDVMSRGDVEDGARGAHRSVGAVGVGPRLDRAGRFGGAEHLREGSVVRLAREVRRAVIEGECAERRLRAHAPAEHARGLEEGALHILHPGKRAEAAETCHAPADDGHALGGGPRDPRRPTSRRHLSNRC